MSILILSLENSLLKKILEWLYIFVIKIFVATKSLYMVTLNFEVFYKTTERIYFNFTVLQKDVKKTK